MLTYRRYIVNPFLLLMAVLSLLTLSACGGGASAPGGGGAPAGPAGATIQLLATANQLNSDGKSPVTLTALVKDVNQNAMIGQAVTFTSTDTGITLTPLSTATDATGKVSATLTTDTDPTNRVVTLTATLGTTSATTTVNIVGTTLSISGSNTLVNGSNTTLSILLKDSSGAKLANKSVSITSVRNTLAAGAATSCSGSGAQITCTSDVNGQVAVRLTATTNGVDTVSAAALGATANLAVTVSGDSFVFISPAPSATTPEINLGTTNNPISVQFKQAGAPMVGQLIAFTTTRGRLGNNPGAAGATASFSATTDFTGTATVYISSASLVGEATITATGPGGTPSAQTNVEFVSVLPTALILQSSPATLSVSRAGAPPSQSEIIALVRDAQNNPVKNITVTFSLDSDASGGTIGSTAKTDSFGRASVFYTAGPSPSGQNGVVVRAAAAGIPNTTTALTVTGTVFIIIGFDNKLATSASSTTVYEKKFVAVVTDTASNPVANQVVTLQMYPTKYYKGAYTAGATAWNWGGYNPGPGWLVDSPFSCNNEDVNNNGVLDAGDNDLNADGIIQPRFPATITGITSGTTSATTDANGIAEFKISYPKNHAEWVSMNITGKTTVGGSESSAQVVIKLPVAATDLQDVQVSPPNRFSPFGVGNCSVTN